MKRLLFSILFLASFVSKAAVNPNLPEVEIFPNGQVWANGTAYNFAGTPDNGIQEAFNLRNTDTNLIHGMVLHFCGNPTNQNAYGNTYFYFTNQINIDPTNQVFDLVFKGDGIVGTKLIYAGSATYTNGAIHFGGPPQGSVFEPFHLTIQDMDFVGLTQATNILVYMGQPATSGDFSYIKMDNVNFESWQVCTTLLNGAGISKNLQSAVKLDPPGLVGLKINSSEEHAVVINNLFGAGLACVADIQCDHLYGNVFKSAFCGVSNTTINASTLWPTSSVYALKAPFIIVAGHAGSYVNGIHSWDCVVGLQIGGGNVVIREPQFEHNSPTFNGILVEPSTKYAMLEGGADSGNPLAPATEEFQAPYGSGPFVIGVTNPGICEFLNYGIGGQQLFQINKGILSWTVSPSLAMTLSGGIASGENLWGKNVYTYTFPTPEITVSNSKTNGVNGAYIYSAGWTAAFPNQTVWANPNSVYCIVSNDAVATPSYQYFLEATNNINAGNTSAELLSIGTPVLGWNSLNASKGSWVPNDTVGSDTNVTSSFYVAGNPVLTLTSGGQINTASNNIPFSAPPKSLNGFIISSNGVGGGFYTNGFGDGDFGLQISNSAIDGHPCLVGTYTKAGVTVKINITQ